MTVAWEVEAAVLVVVAVVLGEEMAVSVTGVAWVAAPLAPVVEAVAVAGVPLAVAAVVQVMVMALVLVADAAAAAARSKTATERAVPRLMRMRMRMSCRADGFWLVGMLQTMCSLMWTSPRSLSMRACWCRPEQAPLVWMSLVAAVAWMRGIEAATTVLPSGTVAATMASLRAATKWVTPRLIEMEMRRHCCSGGAQLHLMQTSLRSLSATARQHELRWASRTSRSLAVAQAAVAQVMVVEAVAVVLA